MTTSNTKSMESWFNNCILELIERYSNLSKIYRLICIWIKYIRLCKSKKDSALALVVHKRQVAKILVKAVQQSLFQKELKMLQLDQIPKEFKFLKPYLDEDGIIRVKGRIQHPMLHTNDLIILPKNHTLAIIFLLKLHEEHQHAGPELLVALSRQSYWSNRTVYSNCENLCCLSSSKSQSSSTANGKFTVIKIIFYTRIY